MRYINISIAYLYSPNKETSMRPELFETFRGKPRAIKSNVEAHCGFPRFYAQTVEVRQHEWPGFH